ncbi:HAD family hydrolase [Asanoa sp. WMMD1127]|uniref:sulfotransferase-like domain-containing protein n=1 Tax=Asanoa sp. WMMD1127 TaxID=3016107 RepID=UPI002417D7CB|nr:HAD family hydrolase [Asanoa sp. WMMD1127]MDG4826638.1 HAD family hydrolase [Asanoa sp. WMMD1127]
MIRIAMWSGPRNVSTALMRSFGARADCAVVDEPLYAFYLAATGLDHPGRAAILASQPTHWWGAVDALRRPAGKALQYEKHMAHHLLPEVGREWLGEVVNAYLIRDPAHVVASYAKVRGTPTLEDLGYPQQVEIFRAHGGPVLDSAALLRDPAGQLRKLCAELGIEFDPAMLTWPAGRRDSDGVWAPHWYAAVERSTGFAPYRDEPVDVPAHLTHLVEAAQPFYDELAAHRL